MPTPLGSGFRRCRVGRAVADAARSAAVVCRRLIAIAASAALITVSAGGGGAGDHRGGGVVHGRLDLGGQEFDPLLSIPSSPRGWAEHLGPQPGLRLLQFHGPVEQSLIDAASDAGIEVLTYIHPFTYVVWSDAQAVEIFAEGGDVRWSGPFRPIWRVQTMVQNAVPPRGRFHALIPRVADLGTVIDAMHELGGVDIVTAGLDDTFDVVAVTLDATLLPAVAHLDGVYTIQHVVPGSPRSEMSSQVNAGQIVGGMAVPGYRDWLIDLGLSGDGVRTAIVDQGVDHEHPDLVQRVDPCIGESCAGEAASSHGTHVAGVLLGDNSTMELDAWGFFRGMGVAPSATFIEQKFWPWAQSAGGFYSLMSDSAANDASISVNAWGTSTTPVGYDIFTRMADVGVRDAMANVEGNQSLTWILAFMNGYGGTSSQGAPDEAKNIMTVGSTQMRSSTGWQSGYLDDLSLNSAHGPALDGRIIPHIVAPGCYVDSCWAGGFFLTCGTSNACPQVAGGAALFLEQWRDNPQHDVDPSPAMIKAAILGSARSLAGGTNADGQVMGPPFDSQQGWGRLDVGELLSPASTAMTALDAPYLLDNNGDSFTVSLSVIDPTQPARIMLVWTDAPGHGIGGSTPAWVNDLDLTVDVGDVTYIGNHFDQETGYSAVGGEADYANNTEGVFLAPGLTANARVTVTAANLAGDGVPGSGDATDQDFALAMFNCRLQEEFTLDVDPVTNTMCLPGTSNWVIELGETYSTPWITLGVDALPIGVTAEFSENPVRPPATVTMTLVADTAGVGYWPLWIWGEADGEPVVVGVTLVISDDDNATTTSISPVDGEQHVATTPLLIWEGVSDSLSYHVQVDETSFFASPIVDQHTPATKVRVIDPLEFDTIYYWRLRVTNACGEGSWTDPVSFQTARGDRILLVDDDGDVPDVRVYYETALELTGATWDVWDTVVDGTEPDTDVLGNYAIVIWFTGYAWESSTGPSAETEVALASWLDTVGGTFLISSQDWLWASGETSFMADYLGLDEAVEETGMERIWGDSDGPFDGLGSWTLSYPFIDYSDTLEPEYSDDGDEGTLIGIAMNGDPGVGAIFKQTPTWRTTWLAFPMEAIESEQDRAKVIDALLFWGGDTAPKCPADCSGDGRVGIEDLLEVLAGWGGSGECDPDGSGSVDVQDLLRIIDAWGECN